MSEIDTSFAGHALALSIQHWMDLGRGDDAMTGTPTSIEEAALRITHLLTIRIIALHHYGQGYFIDLATSTVARAVMDNTSVLTGDVITPSLQLQLETYVTCMLYGYLNDQNPFHNYQHAYHVVISANKFIESMLLSIDEHKQRHVFGLGSDPLSLLALIFAALIHDVGHTGTSNLQRAEDEKELMDRYGDPSIHEYYSLHTAFDELLKDEYSELRSVMFVEADSYEKFRILVWDAVLSTDIANPARAEMAKIKYFDAFPTAGLDEDTLDEDFSGPMGRRSSMASNISMPRAKGQHPQKSRRASAETVSSDLTSDSYNKMKKDNKVSRNTASALNLSRRSSNGSGGTGNGSGSGGNGSAAYGYVNHAPTTRAYTGNGRRHSIETATSNWSEFAADSIRMTRTTSTDAAPRRASVSGAPMQRRLSATHSAESGLAGMAYERRASMGQTMDRRGSGGYGKTGDAFRGGRRNPNKQAKRTNSLELVGAGVGGGEGQEYDADSSLSESSLGDDVMDGVVITGKPSDLGPPLATKADRERRYVRRMSNGVPVKFGSIPQGHRITEENPGDSDFSGHLGIEEDVYSGSPGGGGVYDNVPEELRRQVVIEICLRAADVAHWYQSWDTMVHYNRRIFLELCKASSGDRGFDPRPNWFDNQAKIMETYLLPLAEQIEYIGALRRGSGVDLVSNLESNNDLWLVRGLDVAEALKKEAESQG